jgi:pyruvyltransferase
VNNLHIHALRGPLTRELVNKAGIEGTPEIFGDPALLLPLFFPGDDSFSAERTPLIIPHIDDELPKNLPEGSRVVRPSQTLDSILGAIWTSSVVVTSSLHAKILSDAYGVPSVIYEGKTTDQFKFDDYALGAGQKEIRLAHSFSQAIESQPYQPVTDPGVVDRLLESFPKNIWGAGLEA